MRVLSLHIKDEQKSLRQEITITLYSALLDFYKKHSPNLLGCVQEMITNSQSLSKILSLHIFD